MHAHEVGQKANLQEQFQNSLSLYFVTTGLREIL